MKQPSGFVDREGFSSSEVFVWFETESTCVVW